MRRCRGGGLGRPDRPLQLGLETADRARARPARSGASARCARRFLAGASLARDGRAAHRDHAARGAPDARPAARDRRRERLAIVGRRRFGARPRHPARAATRARAAAVRAHHGRDGDLRQLGDPGARRRSSGPSPATRPTRSRRSRSSGSSASSLLPVIGRLSRPVRRDRSARGPGWPSTTPPRSSRPATRSRRPAGDVATVVKLTRNLAILPVLLGATWLVAPSGTAVRPTLGPVDGGGGPRLAAPCAGRPGRAVVRHRLRGLRGAPLARACSTAGCRPAARWPTCASTLASLLILVALAGVGMSTDLRSMLGGRRRGHSCSARRCGSSSGSSAWRSLSWSAGPGWHGRRSRHVAMTAVAEDHPRRRFGRTSFPNTSMNSAWLRPTLWRWISSKPMST